MKSDMVMHDRINGVGLWIATQLRAPLPREEFFARAARAFPEVPRTTFERSYDLLVGHAFGGHHDDALPVQATAA